MAAAHSGGMMIKIDRQEWREFYHGKALQQRQNTAPSPRLRGEKQGEGERLPAQSHHRRLAQQLH